MPDSVHRKGYSGGWQFVLMCAIHGNRGSDGCQCQFEGPVHENGGFGGWQFVLMCTIHENRDFCGHENKIVTFCLR